MISTGTLWAAIAVLLSALVAICGAAIFVVNLLISNSASANARQFSIEIATIKIQFGIDITRIEVKLDAINLIAVWAEIKELRTWRHDFGPKEMVYDACVDDLAELQRKFDEHCLMAERRMSDLANLERRTTTIEEKRQTRVE